MRTSIVALLIILAFSGCGNLRQGQGDTQLPIAAPGSIGASRAGSWMSPAAKPENLLYVSNSQNNTVAVYAWGHTELVGTLTGFSAPQGLCVDKRGDVFVTDANAAQIVEYTHGGASPIATLSDSGYVPVDCSIDRTTGNLAVANGAGMSGGPGNVAIYQNASGAPMLLSAPNFHSYFRCGYDDSGNLYVGGDTSSDSVLVAELPKGGSTFADISLNQTIYSLGGVKWDGKYLDIEDQEGNDVYQFTISGSAGSLQGTVPLGGAPGAVAAVWIPKFGNGQVNAQATHIVGISSLGPSTGAVQYWAYPAGGSPTKAITDAEVPTGVTVSESER
jgi:hypothetical protein